MVRAGIRTLVESHNGYRVIAEAADGRQAIKLTAQHRPDVVVLDVSMPVLDGIQALPQMLAVSPGTRVLMLSMHESREIILAALRAGAHGYLPKLASVDELHTALDSILGGRMYLSPSVTETVVHAAVLPQPAMVQPEDESGLHPLTSRQQQILKLLASGNTTKQVAYDLGLSVKTVEAHRAQIMERLGIRDLPRLVLYAVRHGLVSSRS